LEQSLLLYNNTTTSATTTTSREQQQQQAKANRATCYTRGGSNSASLSPTPSPFLHVFHHQPDDGGARDWNLQDGTVDVGLQSVHHANRGAYWTPSPSLDVVGSFKSLLFGGAGVDSGSSLSPFPSPSSLILSPSPTPPTIVLSCFDNNDSQQQQQAIDFNDFDLWSLFNNNEHQEQQQQQRLQSQDAAMQVPMELQSWLNEDQVIGGQGVAGE
jgi:hypothetical protein